MKPERSPIDRLIDLLAILAALGVATVLATAFQTLPTASAPILHEGAAYVR